VKNFLFNLRELAKRLTNSWIRYCQPTKSSDICTPKRRERHRG